VIYKRMEPEVDRLLGEYQAGFRKNRLTADHQFTLQQIIEKCGEFNVDLHILFIDFKKAYDSIKHSAIWRALEDLGCPPKLIRMIQLTLKGANAKVRCGGSTSEGFPVGVGLRQGDGLSVLLFNVVLEWIIRKLIRPEDMRKTALTSSFQLLAYADDIAFIARRLPDLKEFFIQLERAAKEVGLEVNEGKTNYLVVSRSKRAVHAGQNFTFGDYNFERVSSYNHLGKLVTGTNNATPAVRERILKGNRCLYGLHNIFRSHDITANTKVKIYKTALRPVVTFGLETCALTAKNEQELEVFERKVLRRIYGPIRDNGQWRKLYNHEIKQIYKSPLITEYLRVQRLLWIGHVQRMNESDRVPKKCLLGQPDGTRLRGRPRARYMELINKDLTKYEITGWEREAADTSEWKRIVWEAFSQQT
jgi:hypothetical protein